MSDLIADLKAAAEAGLAYDAALVAWAEDLSKPVSERGEAYSDELDALYDRWVDLTRAALAKAKP